MNHITAAFREQSRRESREMEPSYWTQALQQRSAGLKQMLPEAPNIVACRWQYNPWIWEPTVHVKLLWIEWKVLWIKVSHKTITYQWLWKYESRQVASALGKVKRSKWYIYWHRANLQKIDGGGQVKQHHFICEHLTLTTWTWLLTPTFC